MGSNVRSLAVVRATSRQRMRLARLFLDLPTLHKLLLTAVLTAGLLAVVGLTSLACISELRTVSQSLRTELVGLSAVKEAGINLLNVSHAVQQGLREHDPTLVEFQEQAIDFFGPALAENLAKADSTVRDSAARANVGAARARVDAYIATAREALRRARAGDAPGSRASADELAGMFTEMSTGLTEVSVAREIVGNKAFARSVVLYGRSRLLVLAVMLLGVLFSTAGVVLVGLSITRPMDTALGVLNAVAEGDLSRSASLDRKDDVGRMVKGLDRAVSNVRVALHEVRGAADTVAGSAESISKDVSSVSSGAQSQAASLEETASTLEQMTVSVRSSADRARKAEDVVVGASATAERGGQVAARAVEAMRVIEQSSKRIEQIIAVIDEIAFQTNLLALNAAVEAARAGEHGRGFAVVASEVRTLSQRTVGAAHEIRDLIRDSGDKVKAGVELVDKAGASLEEIVRSVGQVRSIVGEIASANEEHASGITEINRAVTNMDGVTQASAARAMDMAGAVGSLVEQAARLRELVGRFELGSNAASAELTGERARAA